MVLTEATNRLSALVAHNCNGAHLIAFEVLHENDVEVDAVVLWHNEREWGTHRALLSKVSPNGMLVWGHYYRGPLMAREDYEARVHPNR